MWLNSIESKQDNLQLPSFPTVKLTSTTTATFWSDNRCCCIGDYYLTITELSLPTRYYGNNRSTTKDRRRETNWELLSTNYCTNAFSASQWNIKTPVEKTVQPLQQKGENVPESLLIGLSSEYNSKNNKCLNMYVVQHRLAISAGLLRNWLLAVKKEKEKKLWWKGKWTKKRKNVYGNWIDTKLDASKRQHFSLEVGKNVLLKAPLKSIWWDTWEKITVRVLTTSTGGKR